MGCLSLPLKPIYLEKHMKYIVCQKQWRNFFVIYVMCQSLKVSPVLIAESSSVRVALA